MASFDLAFPFVIKNEGGLTNSQNDSGGLTNYGLTKEDLSMYKTIMFGRAILPSQITDEEIVNLTPDMAKPIYLILYWDKLSLSKVNHQNLATIIFDMAVNRGNGTEVMDVQDAIGTHVDGILGPITISVINAYDPRKLMIKLIQKDIIAYATIVNNRRSQADFIVGWETRAAQYLEFL